MRQFEAVNFSDIEGAQKGRPAIVLCGGPSLPEQYEKVRTHLPDAVLLSANHHGAKFTACDYIVCADKWRKFHPVMPDYEVPIIAPYSDCDFRLISYPNMGNTGMQTVWCAFVLGCCPIVICGADCFMGDTYWWDKNHESGGFRTPPSHHLNTWNYTVKKFCPEEIIRSAGGPLVEVFGEFDPEEDVHQVQSKPTRRILAKGVKIEMTRNTLLRGEPYHKDEVIEVDRKTASFLVDELQKARYYHEDPNH